MTILPGSLLYYFVRWLVSAIAVFLTSRLIKGFEVRDFSAALWASILIGIANAVIWPILILITLPLNLVTLGLFTFVVNGAVLKICAAFLDGFEIKGWPAAIFGAIVLSVVGTALHYLLV